jgi:hypothetical protein
MASPGSALAGSLLFAGEHMVPLPGSTGGATRTASDWVRRREAELCFRASSVALCAASVTRWTAFRTMGRAKSAVPFGCGTGLWARATGIARVRGIGGVAQEVLLPLAGSGRANGHCCPALQCAAHARSRGTARGKALTMQDVTLGTRTWGRTHGQAQAALKPVGSGRSDCWARCSMSSLFRRLGGWARAVSRGRSSAWPGVALWVPMQGTSDSQGSIQGVVLFRGRGVRVDFPLDRYVPEIRFEEVLA